MAKYSFWAAADNHEPARSTVAGTLHTEQGHNQDTTVLRFAAGQEPKDAHKAIYILDNGSSARVLYVAGWSSAEAREQEIWLQPFPVNPSGKTRADNGRVVDYSSWSLGPRRAFHLKMSELSEGAQL